MCVERVRPAHQKLWSDARSPSQTLPRLLTDNLGYGQRSPESLKGSHEFGVVDAAANRLLIRTTAVAEAALPQAFQVVPGTAASKCSEVHARI